MHHRAQRTHQPRPRRHACDGRDERLRRLLSHRLALAWRARGRRDRFAARRAARGNLLAAARERHRRRHRADAVRDRTCLLSRKAPDRTDGAAVARDRFRMVERCRAGSCCAADQRAVPDRRRARAGFILGISDAARAIVYSVLAIRLRATMVGGFLAGIGGSFLSLFYPGSWNEGLSSGQGITAVALVIFARWD